MNDLDVVREPRLLRGGIVAQVALKPALRLLLIVDGPDVPHQSVVAIGFVIALLAFEVFYFPVDRSHVCLVTRRFIGSIFTHRTLEPLKLRHFSAFSGQLFQFHALALEKEYPTQQLRTLYDQRVEVI